MSTEQDGPLAKLSKLLGLGDLAPIAAVKRIDVRPRKLNTPNDLSADQLETLSTNPELLFRVPERRAIDLRARAYDIHVEYQPLACPAERFRAIDLNTYSGAPDEEAPATFVGYGAGAKEAKLALLDLFSEYDGVEPRPRPPVRTVSSSPFELPELRTLTESHDYDDATFDDDLEQP